jgi:hypothetical protein
MPLFEKIKFTAPRLNTGFAKYIDKLQAKDIVKQLYRNIVEIPKTVKILKDYNDIFENDLNSNYIIKSSHGSSWNYNIKPNTVYKIEEICSKLQGWNKLYNPINEKQYSYLEPRFFIEEKIDDKFYGKNGDALAYLIRCIHGTPYTLTLYAKHIHAELQFLFDTNKKLIKIPNMIGVKILDIDITHISEEIIEKMYDVASQMSSKFEFVRIDLYLDKNDTLVFSEFTFTPLAGARNYTMEIEMELGKLWK